MSDSDSSVENIYRVPDAGQVVVRQLQQNVPVQAGPRRAKLIKFTSPEVLRRIIVLSGSFNTVFNTAFPISSISSQIMLPDGPALYTTIAGAISLEQPGREDSHNDCAFLLSHTNILKTIYLLKSQNGIAGMISELSDNTLERIALSNAPGNVTHVDVARIRQRQFANAIYFLHNRGLIHGSLLPHFVHFDSAGIIKVHLAPHPFFRPDRSSTYTADELRNGTLSLPTIESDIYSAGAIIYRIFHDMDPPMDKTQINLHRAMLGLPIANVIRQCWTQPHLRPNLRPSVIMGKMLKVSLPARA